jgi:hypothetical protein
LAGAVITTNSGTSSTTSLAELVVFGSGDDNPRSAMDNF